MQFCIEICTVNCSAVVRNAVFVKTFIYVVMQCRTVKEYCKTRSVVECS